MSGYRQFLLITLVALGAIYVSTHPSFEDRIVDGFPAEPGQFPYQVVLRFDPEDEPYCTGSIIGPRHILTTAHCAYELNNTETARILAGCTDWTGTCDEYTLESVLLHHNYTWDSWFYYNIAVLQLTEDIVLSENVQIVPINKGYVEEGVESVLAGFGSNYNSSNTELRWMDVNTTSFETCKKEWTLLDTEKFALCTLPGVARRGDYGSPLVANGEVIAVLVLFLDNHADLYMRIDDFLIDFFAY